MTRITCPLTDIQIKTTKKQKNYTLSEGNVPIFIGKNNNNSKIWRH